MSIRRILEALGTIPLSPINSELNPKFWDSEGKLLPEVKAKVEALVEAFTEELKESGVPIRVMDTHIVGSNAGYSYTPNSDFDVHIIADMDGECDAAILNSAYQYAKSGFNNRYDIKYKGTNVELYVEDMNASAVTPGIYSIKKDAWVKEPEKPDGYDTLDLSAVEELYATREAQMDRIVSGEGDPQELLDELYLGRKEGLAKEGEFSPGNLVFKMFRNEGKLDELKDLVNQKLEKELSLEGVGSVK